jgi:uncharacterized membrane protein
MAPTLWKEEIMFNSVYEFLTRIGYNHPIHPTEVHMPIGLVVGAFVFAWIALIFHRSKLFETARHCATLAFIWVFPTILFGIMDWQHYYAGAMPFPIKIKIVLAPTLLILLAASVILGYKKGADSKGVLTIYCLCFATVVILGYFGGQLVYGVKAPPPPENLKAGAKLFTTDCMGCHPHGGNILKPNLPLRGAPQAEDLKDFEAFIRSPKMPNGSAGIMPAFPPAKISEPKVRDLYEYIFNVIEHPARASSS